MTSGHLSLSLILAVVLLGCSLTAATSDEEVVGTLTPVFSCEETYNLDTDDGLAPCEWYSEDSCCSQPEVDFLANLVDAGIKGCPETPSDKCLEMLNLLICAQCSPANKDRDEPLPLCASFADKYNKACGEYLCSDSTDGLSIDTTGLPTEDCFNGGATLAVSLLVFACVLILAL